MYKSLNRYLVFATASVLILACALGQASPSAPSIENEVATAVALTVTALPKTATATDTPPPSPTPTLTLPPTATLIPTFAPFTLTPTPKKPEFACDVIEQKPRDDTPFQPNADFDVKWTLVNTGTKKWGDYTYLQYQNGSQMTAVTLVELPRVSPRERYEATLDAIAPAEQQRHVMVWGVYWLEPGAAKPLWMCYPYVRIIVAQ